MPCVAAARQGGAKQGGHCAMLATFRSTAVVKRVGENGMYVYLLRSKACHGERYIGRTCNLRKRLAEHNAGRSIHTNKFMPWELVVAVYFSDGLKAEAFERYLKHGSGHAFARRHLW